MGENHKAFIKLDTDTWKSWFELYVGWRKSTGLFDCALAQHSTGSKCEHSAILNDGTTCYGVIHQYFNEQGRRVSKRGQILSHRNQLKTLGEKFPKFKPYCQLPSDWISYLKAIENFQPLDKALTAEDPTTDPTIVTEESWIKYLNLRVKNGWYD